jgi:hypothetical protein
VYDEGAFLVPGTRRSSPDWRGSSKKVWVVEKSVGRREKCGLIENLQVVRVNHQLLSADILRQIGRDALDVSLDAKF